MPFEVLSAVSDALGSGLYALDCMDGGTGPDAWFPWFVRPACINAPGKVIDRSWGGPCALLGPRGCVLRYADRPYDCRRLVPGVCDPDPMAKSLAAAAWLPYTDELMAIAETLRPNTDF